jgi:SagB-type dehydrogenase family enzyme
MDKRSNLLRQTIAPEAGLAEADALAFETVLAYHQRTKHRLERYAAGPEALDWSNQPDPFRRFRDAPAIALKLGADDLPTSFSALKHGAAVQARPPSAANLGILLELSLGLSAWKEYGPDRWALRCNPSSGNLHPTEGYVVSFGISELPDGVYHYLSSEHVLEQRCRFTDQGTSSAPKLLVGLSSIHWREAWKYGERAFRYCQLDAGHAIGAIRYAAGALGWKVKLRTDFGSERIAQWLGLDRREDFSGTEQEEPELVLEVFMDDTATPESLEQTLPKGQWAGHANVLDRHPMYHWPVIDEVAEASRLLTSWPAERAVATEPVENRKGSLAVSEYSAATIIRQRRSAQRFDGKTRIEADCFYRLLQAVRHGPAIPWDVWEFAPRIHPVFFLHRVEGITPGVYLLCRRTEALAGLRDAFQDGFEWSKPEGCPESLEFFRLAQAECKPMARTLNCHQAIAADSAFALGMLTEFLPIIESEPARYRQLHWEAGLLGQVIYLEAEAAGLRGTGIGCYFDDSFHELLGLKDSTYQSLYHFTAGMPLVDTRILTLPPYPDSTFTQVNP